MQELARIISIVMIRAK